MVPDDAISPPIHSRSGNSLAESLEQAQALAGVGSWSQDVATGRCEWSRQAYRIFEIEVGTPVTYQTFLSHVHPDDLELIQQGWQAAAEGERVHDCVFRILVAGRVKWIHNIIQFEFDEQGQLRSMMGIQQDVTPAKLAEQRLRESEERFRKLFEDSMQAMMLFEDSRCVAANQAAITLFGATMREQLIGRHATELRLPQRLDLVAAGGGLGTAFTGPVLGILGSSIGGIIAGAFLGARDISPIPAQGGHEYESDCLRLDGSRFPARVQTTAIVVGERPLHHAVFTDLTEQRKALGQIEFLAYHDALTGLPNRVSGEQQLRQALEAASRQGESLGVLFLDLDNFKYYNDAYGHAVGDRLLQQLAVQLRQCVRSGETLCRLSGDEFMIVLPQLQSPGHLVRICECIQQRLSDPLQIDGMLITASFSIGAAIHPHHGGDCGTLMRHADIALYESKRSGPGRFRFFEPQMNAKLQHFVSTRAALQEALERQEFELHYQPQFDLRSAELIGVEALLRWRHPDHGLRAPDDFIGIAEESGLIVPIGRWVLEQACRQAASWQGTGFGVLSMAVNLSPVQFRQGKPQQDVRAALAASGLDPARLELELTESTLLQFDSSVATAVEHWKSEGISLAIDDFGTGYSSLSYLKRLRVNKLKIDRSFIVNLNESESDCAIVTAVIQMARSLQIKTVAEGIESPEVAERLGMLGCDQVQGYHYARPMPAAEFERWFRERVG